MSIEIEMNIEFPGVESGASPLVKGEKVNKDSRYLYLLPMDKPIHSVLEDLESLYKMPLKGVHIVHEDTVRSNHKKIQETFRENYAGGDILEAWAFKSFHVEAIASLAKESNSGADVGSRGELELALKVGIEPEKIFCTGPAKDNSELAKIIEVGAFCVLDSYDEAEALNSMAQEKGKVINVGMRINPQPSGGRGVTHSNIFTSDRDSKFGIPVESGHAFKTALQMKKKLKNLKLTLIHFHIGSQIPDLDVYEDAVKSALMLMEDLRGEGITITSLDIGGGYPFSYLPEGEARKIEESGLDTHMQLYSNVTIEDIVGRVCKTIESQFAGGKETKGRSLPRLIFEPGRFIMAGAVGTLGRVLAVKKYDGYITWLQTTISTREFHHKLTVNELMYQVAIADKMNERPELAVSIGGELCCSADVMVSNDIQVLIPKPERGDFIYYANTGAYSIFSAANSHNIPRMPIVLVNKEGRVYVIREPEPKKRVTELDSYPGTPL